MKDVTCVLSITRPCDSAHMVRVGVHFSACEIRMKGIVLVVDNERGIANAAAIVLEQQGYCALAAYRSAAAIKILSRVDVALILSDVNMPGVDGVELALEARKTCPGAKVLLMSGIETAETINQRPGCELCPFQVMAKPFDCGQLVDRIGELLH